MTRESLTYQTRRPWVAPEGYGVDAENPTEGFFRMRLRTGGVQVGIRTFYGPPTEPWTGEEMDRSWRWQADANGQYIEFDRVWPNCAGDPIDAEEYAYLTSLQAWGREHAPQSPHAQPHKKIDLLTAPILI